MEETAVKNFYVKRELFREEMTEKDNKRVEEDWEGVDKEIDIKFSHLYAITGGGTYEEYNRLKSFIHSLIHSECRKAKVYLLEELHEKIHFEYENDYLLAIDEMKSQLKAEGEDGVPKHG